MIQVILFLLVFSPKLVDKTLSLKIPNSLCCFFGGGCSNEELTLELHKPLWKFIRKGGLVLVNQNDM